MLMARLMQGKYSKRNHNALTYCTPYIYFRY